MTAAAVFAFGFANAQDGSSYKPTKGTVTTEVGLTGGLNNANFNLNTGALKFRYFLKDDLGLRLGLGVQNSNFEDVQGTSPNQVTEIEKDNNLTLKFGAEKHFAGSERLSTYAGADLLIGFGKELEETTLENGDFTKGEQKFSGFGISLFTGADYYITKKVFLGVEAGLNIVSEKSKDFVNTTKIGNNTVTTTEPGAKANGIFTQVIGGVRIGYQF